MAKKPTVSKIKNSPSSMLININRELGEIKSTQKAFNDTFTSHIKIDEKIRDDLDQINVTLTRNTLSLEEHMKRSDNIEKITEQLDKRLEYIEIDRESNRKTLSLIAKIGAAIFAIASAVIGYLSSK